MTRTGEFSETILAGVGITIAFVARFFKWVLDSWSLPPQLGRVICGWDRTMAPNFRQSEILTLARDQGKVVVEDLASHFAVTLQTIQIGRASCRERV